jgi:group I intron endonuclease
MSIFIETFPVLVAFGDLHLTELNLQIAKKALHGLSGIYAFVHIPTGGCYIGSSVDLGERIMAHILNHSSNPHLQNAFLKYGLSHFAFVILEYCIPSDQLKREQHYLDILFSLPAYLRYNFARVAEAPFKGLIHTPESKAQMSDSKSGANNPMFGITPTNAFQSGDNNPMYGKVAANAMTINVYSLDNILVSSFPSQVAAAKWLNTSPRTVYRYIKSGKVWNKLYVFRKSSIP